MIQNAILVASVINIVSVQVCLVVSSAKALYCRLQMLDGVRHIIIQKTKRTNEELLASELKPMRTATNRIL